MNDTDRNSCLDQAIVAIKSAEIRRLKRTLKNSLNYCKYFHNFKEDDFDISLDNSDFEDICIDESDYEDV